METQAERLKHLAAVAAAKTAKAYARPKAETLSGDGKPLSTGTVPPPPKP
jgi:hypothetical protein